ncbi:MAG TPA: hypothetical protein VFP93_02430 [Gammaproteobacteria bacterium]|nr:hypothetical protein [Gammaproteobacteria bacterium]
MIEQIIFEDIVYAIIIRSEYKQEGITFVTPNDYSQQLAFMSHPKGKKIQPHIHNKVMRSVTLTQEVLFIKKGKVRVDFYNPKTDYLGSVILEEGSVILLAYGGHGFEMLEPTEMFEIKQGPFTGENDKTRFVCEEHAILIKE